MRFLTVSGAMLVLIAGPAPAYAWANGTGGCDSFGTHDWIVESSAFGRSLRAATSAAKARRPR